MNKYKTIIKKYFPDLEIKSEVLKSNGDDNNAVIINDEYVFRFYKSSKKYNLFFEKEKEVLDKIRPYVSIDIPDLKIYKDYECNFTLHKIIKGINLEEALQKEKRKILDTLPKALAKFITELHSIKNNFLKTEQPKSNNFEFEEELNFFIKEHNLDYDFKKSCEKFDSFEFRDYENVICHNDLYGGNIIINPNTYELSGIIDFTDAIFANYNVDFFSLRKRKEKELWNEVIKIYERDTNRRININYIKSRSRVYLYMMIGKMLKNKEEIPLINMEEILNNKIIN